MFVRITWLLSSISGALVLVAILLAEANISKGQVIPYPIVINEIAWGGTPDSPADEWIELYNPVSTTRNIDGWTLKGDSNLVITLTGTMAGHGYFLLERTDDSTIYDVAANQIYNGVLLNSGASLTLRDENGAIVDTANGDGGPWPAGSGSPDYLSMERLSPTANDIDANWRSNDAQRRNGHTAGGLPINGTPGRPNSAWYAAQGGAELEVRKEGPAEAQVGQTIAYLLAITNTGPFTATQVLMTDTLPAGFTYLGDNSELPVSPTDGGSFQWQVGSLSTGQALSFLITVSVASSPGSVANLLYASTATSESNLIDNMDSLSTTIYAVGSQVLIDAVYFNGYEPSDADEAIRLYNNSEYPVDLAGWSFSDGEQLATFPGGSILLPRDSLWASRNAVSFYRQFGFDPDFELEPSTSAVLDLEGSWPQLNNLGDEVLLYRSDGYLVDAIVFGDGDASQPGWQGLTVQPYTLPGIFSSNGQILFRKRDMFSGHPLPDSDSQIDWAQDPNDPAQGKRALYPGWDVEQFFFPLRFSDTAEIVVGVAPDNAIGLLSEEINNANNSVKIETQTFRSYAIAELLATVANRGVSVTVLLEGSPVGGIDDQERLNCQLLANAGGNCWFMISDSDHNIQDRYSYLHAKFILIDEQRVLISTENLSPDSFPTDDKGDGTWGHRGTLIATDAPLLASRINEIWLADFDPDNHIDLVRWSPLDPVYGAPPIGTVPLTVTGGVGYDLLFPLTFTVQGTFTFELIQSPENSLRTVDGILGLINSLGAGDTLLVQQLEERTHWGPSTANQISDPNPRLEGYIEAARRGVTVRLQLDEFYDSPASPVGNLATCQWANSIAILEKLDLICDRANPTGLGIHNKLLLAKRDGVGYAVIGSLNGSETSHKGNREIALLIQSDGIYQYLSYQFESDWIDRYYFPVIFWDSSPPADHLLISEILYDPIGSDSAEFIELVNPTALSIDLSSYILGDAVQRTDFEDVRRFPEGATVPAGKTVVVAVSASGFQSQFGSLPDFEIVPSHPQVPDMIDVLDWGDSNALLQLANHGDEVLLRTTGGTIVDALAYGSGWLENHISCPLVSRAGNVLERHPYLRDTDNCLRDFRDWPFPSPGNLP